MESDWIIVGAGNMERIKKNFIVNLISWSISLILGICVAIFSTKITEYEIASKILLIVGIIDAVCSFVVLAIFVPYKYCLDKNINRLSKKLGVSEEVKNEDNDKMD